MERKLPKIDGDTTDDYLRAYTKGIQSDQVVQIYNEWSDYDKFSFETGKYNGPKQVAEYLQKYIQKETAKILDLGAGSGRIAFEMQELGLDFDVDALEPARPFFENSTNKHLYKKHICEFLGEGTTTINDDCYDGAVSSGAFGEGHIPCSGLKEIIRILKPGAVMIVAMRHEYIDTTDEYRSRLIPFIEELEAQGKWQILENIIVPNYSWDKTGAFFICKVIESGYTDFTSKLVIFLKTFAL